MLRPGFISRYGGTVLITFFLRLESADRLLLESGDKITEET